MNVMATGRRRGSPKSRRRGVDGMSLLTLIAVVAIVGIFALILLRALLREIDFAVSRQESATLKAYKEALEGAIQRNCLIPGPGQWAAAVAGELGADTGRVATNPRRQARLLLVDTNGWFGNYTLPYDQAAAITTIKPVNARLMIVSNLGNTPLPVLGNPPTGTEFAALWDCPDNQVPASVAWTGWNGRREDVKVERILLDPLFMELNLRTSRYETHYGLYSIGASGTLIQAPLQQPSFYVLRGTKVWLYAAASAGGALDSRQIVTKSGYYRYEDGIWKSSAVGADLPGGLDLAAVVKAFLQATPNTNALNSSAQQLMVTSAMMDFMRGYSAWGAAGFPDNGTREGLILVQQQMMARCQELFMDGGTEPADSFPINNGPCE